MNISGVIQDDLLLELVGDLLDMDREAKFTARGGSMHPVIRDGDRVAIAPATAEDLEKGCIALYTPPLPNGGHGMVIHRFIAENPDGTLVMKGDSCNHPDPPVNRGWVIGKVVEIQGKRSTVVHDSIRGKALLQGKFPIVPKLTSGLSRLRSRLHEGKPLPGIPLTPRELSRQKMLLTLAMGDNESFEQLDEFEDNGGRIQFNANETSLIPLIMIRAVESGFDPATLLPSHAEEVHHEAIWKSAQAEAAIRWLHEKLADGKQTALLTKGAAVAWTVYPEPHCRPYADIDLLIKPEDVAAITDTLLKAGASLAEPEYTLPYYMKYKNEIALRLPEKKWPVLELHWRGTSSPWYNRYAHTDDFRENTESSEFGEHLKVMNTEAEFVYCIAHMAKHMPHLNPIWALDMMLMAKKNPNWNKIRDMIEHDRLFLPAAISVKWIGALSPGTIPLEVTKDLIDIATRNSGRLERMLLYRQDGLATRLAEAWSQPEMGRKIAALCGILFPPRRTLTRMFAQHASSSTAYLHALRILRKLRSGPDRR